MLRLICSAVVVALLITTVAAAADYSVETIWVGSVCGQVSLNDHDDVAWAARSADRSSCEIRFYDASSGTVSVISQSYLDGSPKLANSGDIAWSRGNYPAPRQLTLMYYEASTGKTYEFDPIRGGGFSINGHGDLVRIQPLGPHPSYEISVRDAATGVWFVVGVGDGNFREPLINDRGHVAWLGDQHAGTVMSQYDPVTSVVSEVIGDGNAHNPDMNARGDLAWEDGLLEIFYHEAGSRDAVNISRSWPFDYYPRLSDRGDIYWTGSTRDRNEHDIFRYDGDTGRVERLTDNEYPGYGFWDTDVNAWGDAAWVHFPPYGLELFVHNKALGATVQVAEVDEPEWPKINDRGTVAVEFWPDRIVLVRFEAPLWALSRTVYRREASGQVGASLVAKLVGNLAKAHGNAEAGRTRQAVENLEEFKATATKGRKRGTIDPAAAAELMALADDAIASL
jgi:hypothetical protein